MVSDRDKLSSRVLPFMTLSNGTEASSLTAPPPPLPHYLNAEGRALARFAVEGNVVVTGGAGTLGLSAARALLEHGASGLCIWDLEATLRTSQTEIQSLASDFPSKRIFSIGVDVTDSSSLSEAVDNTVQILGSLDHVLCFAGIVGCYHALEMPDEAWRRTFDVNSTGSFFAARACARQMVKQNSRTEETADAAGVVARGGGYSVTLVASISASRVNFPQAQAAYNASKAAIVNLKSSLAAEWAVHGIRVNCISPGYMDTILNAGEGNIKEARDSWASRNPMGRMGALGELDGMCVLLASRAGSYVNGAELIIDGGAVCF